MSSAPIPSIVQHTLKTKVVMTRIPKARIHGVLTMSPTLGTYCYPILQMREWRQLAQVTPLVNSNMRLYIQTLLALEIVCTLLGLGRAHSSDGDVCSYLMQCLLRRPHLPSQTLTQNPRARKRGFSPTHSIRGPKGSRLGICGKESPHLEAPKPQPSCLCFCCCPSPRAVREGRRDWRGQDRCMAVRGLPATQGHASVPIPSVPSRCRQAGTYSQLLPGVQPRGGNHRSQQLFKNAPPRAGPSVSFGEGRCTAQKNGMKTNHLCVSRLHDYVQIVASQGELGVGFPEK